MEETVKIESVFEENYCICGHKNVDKFSNISDTFIKYRNQLISFVEIVRETLNFEPTPENCSMELCSQCKNKLQEFYNFKIKTISAMKLFKDFREISHSDNQVKESEQQKNDGIEYTLLDIIKNYVKIHSIKSIEIHEDSKGLIVTPANIVENSTNIETEITSNTEEETEYLEEFLEETLETAEHQDYTDNETIESQSENDIKIKSKGDTAKRLRNPEEWACNKRKRLRNLGKSYLNSKGKIVGERKMLEPCINCRSKCQKRLSESDRSKNFTNYWNLGDVVAQRKFIYNHILSKKPSRRKSVQSNRSVTLQFHLDAWNEEGNVSCVQVCKKMFKNTLAISNQIIQGVVSKYANTGFVDPRGKHKRKVTESQILAQQHVQKFPFFYVEQSMTKVQLYNMYVDECTKKDIEPVKESHYREIFDKFNANSFLKTEKVLCKKCHSYLKATDDERKLLKKDFDIHLSEDKKCRDRALSRIRHRRSIEKRKAQKSQEGVN